MDNVDEITHDFFADVAKRFQSALLEVVVLQHHVIHEALDQVGPLVTRKLDDGDFGQDLSKI
jgi:hypothetical protein